LPVWGASFVNQWLDYGIPSLLASGNLPLLAAQLPCHFEILTTRDMEQLIRQHPGFNRLSRVCPCTITPIDHLVTSRNHSTAITLAYEEAVRALGRDMLDTLFFFMVSDFIFSDGSFGTVLNRVQSGADAVMVGNLQVVAQKMIPLLSDLIEPERGVMQLDSRQLMRLCADNLHPAISANFVNNHEAHNAHTNRLFWRVDQNTLLGRVYLKHMLAIRPETTEFEIGASCDYSFVPEMCPSGRVAEILDSDECLAVEVQPDSHESGFLRPGKMSLPELGSTLSEWTTERHRKNADKTILFHTGELPASVPSMMAEVDSYMSELNRYLSPQAKAHRWHPYWLGAIAASKETRGLPLSKDEEYWLCELTTKESRRMEDVRHFVFGKPPLVHAWHPHWPDYKPVLDHLHELVSNTETTFACLSNAPSPWTVMLSKLGSRYKRIEANQFLEKPSSRFQHLENSIDVCVLELTPPDVPQLEEFLLRLAPMLKANGKVFLILTGSRSFSPDLIADATAHVAAGFTAADIRIIPLTRFRKSIIDAHNSLVTYCRTKRYSGVPLFLSASVPLSLLTMVANFLSANRLSGWTVQPGTPEADTCTIHAVFQRAANMNSSQKAGDRSAMVS
jgi:hypothetical protein